MPKQDSKKLKVGPLEVLIGYIQVAKPYWFILILVVIGSITPTISSSIIIPIYYKNFFDILSVKTEKTIILNELVHTILLILIMNFIAWAGYRLLGFSMTYFQTRIMTHLRQNAYEYLIGHSYTFFTNTFSGSLVQKVNRYMRSFERVTDRFFGEILQIITKIIGVCVVLWYIRPTFVFLILVWIFIYFILSLVFSRWKIPYDIKSSEVESKTTAVLADSLSNHYTIQIFDRHGHEASVFGKANLEHTLSLRKRWNIANKIEAIQAFINIGVEFLIFYIAIQYWGMGYITVGTFVLIQIYVLSLMDNFWGLSRIIRDIYESFADAKEMVEIMKTEHEIKDVPGAKDLIVNEGLINFNNVSFSYNEDREILSNLNLSIRPGERVALIGPSGAGKSTITKLLLRLYELTGGEILIDKQNISKSTQSSLRNAISFVPQDPILFHRTLAENIRYGALNATDEQVRNAAKLAYIDEFINSLTHGYETFVGERGVKLSGGERQRVAIARAILKNAPILILDEATSSLDSQSEMLIQDALENLMKDKTVIVIAHRLSTIRKMNRIVVIDEGKVLEQGTHNELLERGGLYSKLWNLQSKGFLVENEDHP